MRYCLTVIGVVAALGVASAQQLPNGTIVSVTVQIFQPGVDPTNPVSAPFQVNTYQLTPAMCNQPAGPFVGGTVVNPTKVAFADPTHPGMECVTDQSTLLVALQAVSQGQAYLATLMVTDDFGLTSGRSQPSNPFVRRQPPTAVTGVKVIQ